MYDNLYSKVDIATDNVHYLNPSATDLQEECARFDALISSHGGLDLAFFGTGADGHVARNEPGSSLKSSTRVTRLAYDTRVQLSQRWSRRPVASPSSSACDSCSCDAKFEAGLGIRSRSCDPRSCRAFLLFQCSGEKTSGVTPGPPS